MRQRQVPRTHRPGDLLGQWLCRGDVSTTIAPRPAARMHRAAASDCVPPRHDPGRPSRATLARPSVRRTSTGVSPWRRDRSGKRERRFDARRQRRAAAAGQARQAALGPHQRPRGRQDQFGGASAKRQQGDVIAADVALGQQQFHRTLGFSQSVQRRGTGGIDDEDRRRARVPSIALHPEVFRAYFDAWRAATLAAGAAARSRRRTGCHGAAARRVSMMFSLAPRRGSPRTTPAGRPRAPSFCSWPARPALADRELHRCRDLQLRQQPRWNRCGGGGKHAVLEGAILRARLLLLAIGRRLRRCLGFRRLRGFFGWRAAANVSPSARGPAWQLRPHALPCTRSMPASAAIAAGGSRREQRSPHRGDAQCQRGRAQRFDAGHRRS